MSPSRLSSVSSSEKSELLFVEVRCLISFPLHPPPHPPTHPEQTARVALIAASHDAAFPFKVKAAGPNLPSDNPNTDGTSSEEMLADGKSGGGEMKGEQDKLIT